MEGVCNAIVCVAGVIFCIFSRETGMQGSLPEGSRLLGPFQASQGRGKQESSEAAAWHPQVSHACITCTSIRSFPPCCCCHSIVDLVSPCLVNRQACAVLCSAPQHSTCLRRISEANHRRQGSRVHFSIWSTNACLLVSRHVQNHKGVLCSMWSTNACLLMFSPVQNHRRHP